MHTLSKFMITNYRRGGAFHNYLNRRNCEIIVKQENEPLNKILNSASTLLQLRFEGRDRINWDSVGDSYLFHWDGDNVNSLINVEKSNQPNTISFRGTYFRPECDTCKISKGDKIIITTDQMGEFLSDGIDAIPIVVSKLTESPNIKSMKKKWIDICNEVWANNDSIVNILDVILLVNIILGN